MNDMGSRGAPSGYSSTTAPTGPPASSGYGGRGGMLDGRGGMLDVRGGMPDDRGGMPERHGGMPDVRGGMPDVRGGMPERHGGMPDVRGGMPDVRGGMPDVRGGMPERHGGMPDVRGGMPDVRGHGGIPDPPQISSARSFDWDHGMPDGRGGMPDGRGGMPDVRGGVPDGRGSMSVSPQMSSAQSFDTIIISNLPLDCDWQVRIIMFPWVFLLGNSWEFFSYSRESEANSRKYQKKLNFY